MFFAVGTWGFTSGLFVSKLKTAPACFLPGILSWVSGPWAALPSECGFSGCFKKNAELAPWWDWKTNLSDTIQIVRDWICSDQLISFSWLGIPVQFRLEPAGPRAGGLCGWPEWIIRPLLIRKETLQSTFKVTMPKNDSSAWFLEA